MTRKSLIRIGVGLVLLELFTIGFPYSYDYQECAIMGDWPVVDDIELLVRLAGTDQRTILGFPIRTGAPYQR
jgi:hypothetical protein